MDESSYLLSYCRNNVSYCKLALLTNIYHTAAAMLLCVVVNVGIAVSTILSQRCCLLLLLLTNIYCILDIFFVKICFMLFNLGQQTYC